jgi:hypothetical protein
LQSIRIEKGGQKKRFLTAHRPETLAASAGHDDDETVLGVGLGFQFS